MTWNRHRLSGGLRVTALLLALFVARNVPALAQEKLAQGHRITQQLNHLRPVLEWNWGAVLATALAMVGAILVTLPVALVYRRTKSLDDYDPGVTQSSIILAPTIAGVLMVIQGSLAMAFSLAGVVTAVRFRNSLKNTNDAVYVFVAVAIGLAAGGQALDIAVAISTVFCLAALLVSKTPLRAAARPAGAGNHHGHNHEAHQNQEHIHQPQVHDLAERLEPSAKASRLELLTVRTARPDLARPAIQAVLGDETKEWRLDRESPGADGSALLLYMVYRRKRVPRDELLEKVKRAAESGGLATDVSLASPGRPAAPEASLASAPVGGHN